MENSIWTVTYEDPSGSRRTIDVSWEGKPTFQEAACQIQHELLGAEYLLVDTPRAHSEPTVFLLKHHGFTLMAIDSKTT